MHTALALALVVLALPIAATGEDVPVPKVAAPILDHADLTAVLAQVVDDDGAVDYAALRADRAGLDRYLAALARTGVPRDRHGAMAYYINAYNVFTLQLVLRLLPADQAAWSGFSVAEQEGFWKAYRFELGGARLTLDEIEHQRLRPMGDPRIHFAVNCASRSCPPLVPEAYVRERLEAQLEAAAVRFARSPYHVRTVGGKLVVNQLLDWFKGDFGGVDGVRRFLAQRQADEARRTTIERAAIGWFDYEWSLNRPGNMP